MRFKTTETLNRPNLRIFYRSQVHNGSFSDLIHLNRTEVSGNLAPIQNDDGSFKAAFGYDSFGSGTFA